MLPTLFSPATPKAMCGRKLKLHLNTPSPLLKNYGSVKVRKCVALAGTGKFARADLKTDGAKYRIVYNSYSRIAHCGSMLEYFCFISSDLCLQGRITMEY